MTNLPHLSFDTSNFEPSDRLDAVADLWRHYLSFKFDRNLGSAFHLSSSVWWFGDCSFVHSLAGPMSCHRPSPPEGEAMVSISYLLQGIQDYVLNGELRRQSGDAVHVSTHAEQSHRFCHTDSEMLILYVPVSRFGLFSGQLMRSRTFPTSGFVGVLLRSVLLNLSGTLENGQWDDGEKLADSVCGFLQPLLRDPPDRLANTAKSAKITAIQRYIDENIADQGMSIDQICKRFAVSRATLYRMFSETDGVMTYVSRRRVQRVYDELVRTKPKHGIVRIVAEKHGFYDQSHFNRLFRRQVGITPGSVAGLLHMRPGKIQSTQNGQIFQDQIQPLLFSRPVPSS